MPRNCLTPKGAGPGALASAGAGPEQRLERRARLRRSGSGRGAGPHSMGGTYVPSFILGSYRLKGNNYSAAGKALALPVTDPGSILGIPIWLTDSCQGEFLCAQSKYVQL